MSKWRPSEKDCIYVIPDVHGASILLKNICDRILPLRKSDGGKDRLIFLGDLIDRHIDSHKVIDQCIEIQKRCGDKAVFLMGNHELMLLKFCNKVRNKSYSLQDRKAQYNMWMANGGLETLVGYMERSEIKEKPMDFPMFRIENIIPKEHMEFFQNLKPYYEFEDYIFVHAGLNPLESPDKHETEVLVWDRDLLRIVMEASKNGLNLPWDKTVIAGHNVVADRKPVIYQKFMMLDCGSPHQLLVAELRSREAYMSQYGKDKLSKFVLEERKPQEKKVFFRRASFE